MLLLIATSNPSRGAALAAAVAITRPTPSKPLFGAFYFYGSDPTEKLWPIDIHVLRLVTRP